MPFNIYSTAFKCAQLGKILKKYKNIEIFYTESKKNINHSQEVVYTMMTENGISINNRTYKMQYLKLSYVPENVYNIENISK